MLKKILNFLFKKSIETTLAHEKLSSELSLEEVLLGHNEITYGYFLGTLCLELHNQCYDRASSKEAYRYVETATSLFQRAMFLKGTPISYQEKVQYRFGLTKAVSSILRNRDADYSTRLKHAKNALAPYHLNCDDCPEPEDRHKLDQVISQMLLSVK